MITANAPPMPSNLSASREVTGPLAPASRGQYPGYKLVLLSREPSIYKHNNSH